MNIQINKHYFIKPLLFFSFILFLVNPCSTVKADQYSESLSYVERYYGEIVEVNREELGTVQWRIVELIITAKKLKSAGDDEGATRKILHAEELVKMIE
jgi:hypothetical protein